MKNDARTNFDDSKQTRQPSDPLTESWMAFVQSPHDEIARNQFARELDAQVGRFLSSASTSHSLRHLLEDVRQEANLMLISKLLAGNRELVAATRVGDHDLVAGQLRRSISAAIRFSKWKLFKELGSHPTEFLSVRSPEELATYQHPACLTELRDLPLETQQTVVTGILKGESGNLQIAPATAELACRLIEENISQAELARSLGVSRQAIFQRLEPVWRHLRRVIEDQEFPLS